MPTQLPILLSRQQLFVKHFDLRMRLQLKGLKQFYRMDCSSGGEFLRVVQKHHPDVVVNLAGPSLADVCKNNVEEAVQSMYQLNANILQALKVEHSTQFSSLVKSGNLGDSIYQETLIIIGEYDG